MYFVIFFSYISETDWDFFWEESLKHNSVFLLLVYYFSVVCYLSFTEWMSTLDRISDYLDLWLFGGAWVTYQSELKTTKNYYAFLRLSLLYHYLYGLFAIVHLKISY